MEVPILLEHLPADGYRATSLAPARLSVDASSREEAIAQIGRLVQEHFSHAELIHVNVPLPGESHPWHPLAGTWIDQNEAAELERHMREYRRQIDADPDRL
jgi:hypothetical protein